MSTAYASPCRYLTCRDPLPDPHVPLCRGHRAVVAAWLERGRALTRTPEGWLYAGDFDELLPPSRP